MKTAKFRILGPSSLLLLALAAAACGSGSNNLTRPSDTPNARSGAQVNGSFESGLAAAEVRAHAASTPQGLRVTVRELPGQSAQVGADGRFRLSGLPPGAFTLLFERGGPAGEVRVRDVQKNQQLELVFALAGENEVVLVDDTRAGGTFEGGCPRGGGFWCQNQDGRNPNLSASAFQAFAAEAAADLGRRQVAELDTAAEVAAAVCDQGDQLLRQLATLALNLAADKVTLATPLEGEPYATVGAAYEAAVTVFRNPSAGRSERNRVKDVLERTNEGQNTGGGECALDEDQDGEDDPPSSAKLTICHIPPGNPAARHTIEIGAAAWPAHKAHGDTKGACR